MKREQRAWQIEELFAFGCSLTAALSTLNLLRLLHLSGHVRRYTEQQMKPGLHGGSPVARQTVGGLLSVRDMLFSLWLPVSFWIKLWSLLVLLAVTVGRTNMCREHFN